MVTEWVNKSALGITSRSGLKNSRPSTAFRRRGYSRAPMSWMFRKDYVFEKIV